MTYRGSVKNGVVVLEEAVRLPEGALVEVAIIEKNSGDENDGDSPRKKLMEFAGSFSGLPEDGSINVDHYLYGHPKK